MQRQLEMEVIKSLAYGETPAEVSEANGVSVSEVLLLQRDCAAEIARERETLKKAGYING